MGCRWASAYSTTRVLASSYSGSCSSLPALYLSAGLPPTSKKMVLANRVAALGEAREREEADALPPTSTPRPQPLVSGTTVGAALEEPQSPITCACGWRLENPQCTTRRAGSMRVVDRRVAPSPGLSGQVQRRQNGYARNSKAIS